MRIYLHWPFCLSRCLYCDFNTRVANARVWWRYRESILAEARAWSRKLPQEVRPIASLYLGGGTPSTMRGVEVAGLVGEISGFFGMRETAEVTVEVNPATWSYDDFARARAGGANRFSIGVQSTLDDALKLLGRAHNGEEAKKAVSDAMRCGATSVSVDLLYGLPGMDVGLLRSSLQEVMGLEVQHISIYALTLSEKAPMARVIARGGISLPEEDKVADQYMEASSMLEDAGYHRYEISNFCRPGHHSRHNLACWRREEYLGIGAGAHSFLGRCRFSNVPSLMAYMRRIKEGISAVEQFQALGEEEELEEEVMLGLRTSFGIPEELLKNMDGRVDELESGGFLNRGGGRVWLTGRGMLVSNAVIAELCMNDGDEAETLDGRSQLRQSYY